MTPSAHLSQAKDLIRWHHGELQRHMAYEEWDLASIAAKDLSAQLRTVQELLHPKPNKKAKSR